MNEFPVFSPAEALLPQGVDLTAWSVVACDQFTSEPDYWRQVEETVGEKPSTLRLTLPEIYLSGGEADARAADIRAAMRAYLENGVLGSIGRRYVYVERTLRSGMVRPGLVGMVDLERYDYRRGSRSLVRATEGTVLERIPPRVKIREGAPLELPHILLLMDDPADAVFSLLRAGRGAFEPLYDFGLMQRSGRLKGSAVDAATAARVDAALGALGTPEAMAEKYGVTDRGVLLFAVGDGNHSLATAKECFERLKKTLPENEWKTHPARWAMVELQNLHDPSLQFEPIHRVLFGTVFEDVLAALGRFCGASETPGGGQSFEVLAGGKRRRVWVQKPCSNLAVGTLQAFLDQFTVESGGRVDYIHGGEVVEKLAAQPGNVGFLLPAMGKGELFRTVLLDGALPRKTFSMGHAWDKRFYLESRRITR